MTNTCLSINDPQSHPNDSINQFQCILKEWNRLSKQTPDFRHYCHYQWSIC